MKNKLRISAAEIAENSFPFDLCLYGVKVNFYAKGLCSFDTPDCYYSLSDTCVLSIDGDVMNINSDNGFKFTKDPLNPRGINEGMDLTDIQGLSQISSGDLRDDEEINIHFGRQWILARKGYIKITGDDTFADIYARWLITVDNKFLRLSCSYKGREAVFVAIKK